MDWRGFHSELQRAAVAATQTGAPLSLLMLELEDPGRSRERRGGAPVTPSGRVAGLVKAAVAERGLLARYDAERLAVILLDTDLEAAIGRAESIVRSLSAPRRGTAAGMGASPAIGIAQFRDEESLGHLIQRTADALRRARTERGLAVSTERGARERPIRARGGTPSPAAAYALKDER
jgi:PleD family two-component response regulator